MYETDLEGLNMGSGTCVSMVLEERISTQSRHVIMV